MGYCTVNRPTSRCYGRSDLTRTACQLGKCRRAWAGGATAFVVGCGGGATPTTPTLTATASSHGVPTRGGGLPEHGRIAFTLEFGTTGSLNAHILTIEPNGTDLRTLTTTAGFDDDPTWTPMADRILFGRTFPTGTNDANATSKNLFSMDAEGAAIRQLTSEPAGVYDDGPVMSPDGTRIAFERFDLSGRRTGIYLMKADGTNVTRITVTPASAAGGDHEASFSPDGTKLAFVRDAIDGGKGVIYVVGVDGKGLRQLTQTSLDVARPRWSPDGTKLVFGPSEAHAASGSDVFVVNSDGTGLTALTHEDDGNSASGPDWSPDGTMIVFVQYHAADNYLALALMHSDGTDPVVIWHPCRTRTTFRSTRHGGSRLEQGPVYSVPVGVVMRVAVAGEKQTLEDASFEAAFAAEERRLFTIALSILRDPAEAQDATQETALIGWRRWSSLRDPASTGAWLAKICVHHCVRRKRVLIRWLTVDDAVKNLRAGLTGTCKTMDDLPTSTTRTRTYRCVSAPSSVSTITTATRLWNAQI